MDLKRIVESKSFEKAVVLLISINAISLGLETIESLDAGIRSVLFRLDQWFLILFSMEIILKLIVYRQHFFRDPWRCFDFLIVGISILPSSGPLTIIRSLRILRALRMISVVPALRRVVNGLLLAIPGLGAVATIMALIFYVGAVMATNLFREAFPDWFGTIWASAYSLFQIMTLESWSMGIVRPVMATYPWAWLFFLPFILITTFTMLNLFIAVIVNAMQVETEAAAEQREQRGHDERGLLLQELARLQRSVDELKAALPYSWSQKPVHPVEGVAPQLNLEVTARSESRPDSSLRS